MSVQISLIDEAVKVLEQEKRPYDVYDLFELLTANKTMTEDERGDLLTKFYTDLTISANFVYVGENQWDLKANQKIELWEKDGSFYKEYTKVDLPKEYLEEAKPKPKPKAVVEAKPEQVEEVVQEELVVVEEVITEVIEETPAVVQPETVEDTDETAVDNYEEEVFEDFDEFDEEQYNEYMDTYEDEYDK